MWMTLQSDHNGVVVTPLSDANIPVKRTKFVKTIRPISSSNLQNIGQVLNYEKWSFMNPKLTSTQITDLFENYTGGIIDLFCPEKQVLSRPGQIPYITEDLKVLKRKIMRQYEKHGKSQKYFELKTIFKQKVENEAQKYKERIIDDVKNGDRSSTYSALRRLGVRPGESESDQFTLPAHAEANLSASQSAALIADHFSKISMDYQPINLSEFPPVMRDAFACANAANIPQLEEHEVYRKMCRAKKPNSAVPGDIPKKIIKEFSCEFSAPLTIIYNSILNTFEYPRQWVVEHQIPIPKVTPPASEDDLRNIAKTAFASKCFESFLSD